MNTEKIINTFNLLDQADLIKSKPIKKDYTLEYDNFIVKFNKVSDAGKNQQNYKLHINDNEDKELFTIRLVTDSYYKKELIASIYINNNYVEKEYHEKLLSMMPLNDILDYVSFKANNIIVEKQAIEQKNKSQDKSSNEKLIISTIDRIKAMRNQENPRFENFLLKVNKT